MIVSKLVNDPNAEQQLKEIYSDLEVYIIKDSILYTSVIMPQDEPLSNYLESAIPLPSKKLSKIETLERLLNTDKTFTLEQVNMIRNLFIKASNLLTPEEALQIDFFFNEWLAGIHYNVNDKIRYNNRLYMVTQEHISNLNITPAMNSGYYMRIKTPISLVVEWNEDAVYELGDRVHYGQYVYESMIDNNSWSPETFSAAWKLIEEGGN